METDLDSRLGGEHVPIHVRFIGRPACSGRKQALFTFFCEEHATAGIACAWWWTFVPEAVGSRGWRYLAARWLT